jgi:glycosyltransferase involved in cell wall biosynthesis
MKVSIIIPVREINDYIRESIPYILKQTYKDFEIIIFPDSASNETFDMTKVIPTGPMGPAAKRDLSLKHATGEILAFMDDDAYPREDWLENAVIHFGNSDIAAVGGPAVTPKTNNIFQKASGGVFETKLGGGNLAFRYIPKSKMFVDDYPSVNLLVRKSVFREVGGFDSHYYPGEDTKLCLDITKNLGKKIFYDPEVYVWHHRRELFKPHLKQIGNYAIHRGKFVKEFPETSLRLCYFLPSLFFLFLLFGSIASIASFAINITIVPTIFLAVLLFYFSLLFIDVLRFKNPLLSTLVALGVFTTHMWYGYRFLIGLTKKHLER